MSFAFMPLYTGDYLRDTQHLSMLEHGAYLKLLMYCWDQKGPAPHDERKLMGICNARSKEEIGAMQSVLMEYFVRMDDGWHNVRLTKELQKAEAIGYNRAEAGRLGGLARAAKQAKTRDSSNCQASAKHEPSNCLANAKHVPVTPTPTPTPTTTPKNTNTHTRFAARVYLSGKGVDDQLITDWLAIRKDKKLTPTLAAMETIEAEAVKAGKTLPEAIRICCENAWGGFKASWLTSQRSGAEPDYSSVV